MNKKIIQIIVIIAGILLTAGVLFFLIAQLQTPSDTYGLLEPILGVKNFNTSTEHKKALGIKTANISEEERIKIIAVIKEVVKAQEEYNLSKKEESLDKVKNLYLPGIFEVHREEAKKLTTFYASDITDTVETLKFSSPRIYKDLPDRIGIINNIVFSFSQEADVWPRDILQIFIFKNTNKGWKIEKQQVREGMAGDEQLELEAIEARLVKQIIDQ